MTQPYFYHVAHVQSSDLNVDVIEVEDPFDLLASEIVERLMAIGCVPTVESL